MTDAWLEQWTAHNDDMLSSFGEPVNWYYQGDDATPVTGTAIIQRHTDGYGSTSFGTQVEQQHEIQFRITDFPSASERDTVEFASVRGEDTTQEFNVGPMVQDYGNGWRRHTLRGLDADRRQHHRRGFEVD